jgi:hypothetical protein
LSKRLDTLSLARTCRSIWVTSIAHLHTKDESQIALIGQRCVHELGSVALILECVIEEGITHSYFALLTCLNIDVVLELLEPHPIVDVHRLHDRVFDKLINYIHAVDDVKNERLHF